MQPSHVPSRCTPIPLPPPEQRKQQRHKRHQPTVHDQPPPHPNPPDPRDASIRRPAHPNHHQRHRYDVPHRRRCHVHTPGHREHNRNVRTVPDRQYAQRRAHRSDHLQHPDRPQIKQPHVHPPARLRHRRHRMHATPALRTPRNRRVPAQVIPAHRTRNRTIEFMVHTPRPGPVSVFHARSLGPTRHRTTARQAHHRRCQPASDPTTAPDRAPRHTPPPPTPQRGHTPGNRTDR